MVRIMIVGGPWWRMPASPARSNERRHPRTTATVDQMLDWISSSRRWSRRRCRPTWGTRISTSAPLIGPVKVGALDADGTFVWLAMVTGARRGELCALRWEHLDFAAGVLAVRRCIWQRGKRLGEKDTKDHQERRVAPRPRDARRPRRAPPPVGAAGRRARSDRHSFIVPHHTS